VLVFRTQKLVRENDLCGTGKSGKSGENEFYKVVGTMFISLNFFSYSASSYAMLDRPHAVFSV